MMLSEEPYDLRACFKAATLGHNIDLYRRGFDDVSTMNQNLVHNCGLSHPRIEAHKEFCNVVQVLTKLVHVESEVAAE